MKNIEYKFIKLPYIKIMNLGKKDDNDRRIPLLEESFNSLGKEGFELVKIYWWEGLALFKRENE